MSTTAEPTKVLAISALHQLVTIIVPNYQGYYSQTGDPFSLEKYLSPNIYEKLILDMAKIATQSGSEGLYCYLEDMGAQIIYDPQYWLIADCIASIEQDTLTIDPSN